MTFEEQKRAAVERLEDEARKQATEDRRIYLEGMGYLYLVAVLLAGSDAENLRGAQEHALRVEPIQEDEAGRRRAELVAEDLAMTAALEDCRRLLLEKMPAVGGQVLESCRRAPSLINADEPFNQIAEAVGPHGLAFLAVRYAAARIARKSAGATASQEITH
jgi:hypothetical protein